MNSEAEESFRFTAPTDRPTTVGLSITGACVCVVAAPGCLLSGCALHGYAGKRATLPRWAGGSAGACESAHQQRLADNKNRQPMKQAASMAESAALFFFCGGGGGEGALAAFTAALLSPRGGCFFHACPQTCPEASQVSLRVKLPQPACDLISQPTRFHAVCCLNAKMYG